MTYPGRSLHLSGRARLPQRKRSGKGVEKSAEAIVVSESDEGLNLLRQGADGETRWMWSNSKARGPS